MTEEQWQVNIPQKTKRINLKNLFNIDSKDFKTKNVSINPEYTSNRYEYLLENNFLFLNFEDNSHYINFTESEYEFIVENNQNKNFNLENFTKIIYNEDIEESKYDLQKLKLNKWNIITSFKIRNVATKKIINCFVYSYYDEKKDKRLFGVFTYFERNYAFLMLLTSYLEVLLYIYKIECEMGKNPQLSKLVNKYPYEFKNLNINDIKNYFNNLPKVWLNNK